MNSGMNPPKAFCWALALAGSISFILWNIVVSFAELDYRHWFVYLPFLGTVVLLGWVLYRGYRNGTWDRWFSRRRHRGSAIIFVCLAVLWVVVFRRHGWVFELAVVIVWCVLAADQWRQSLKTKDTAISPQ